VWSALPDIVTLDSRFDIRQIVLLQHNDCGTSHVTKELVNKRISDAVKSDDEETKKMRDNVVEHKISHGEEGVREDLGLLRTSPFLRKELVESAVGFWLDTFTGLAKVVS